MTLGAVLSINPCFPDSTAYTSTSLSFCIAAGNLKARACPRSGPVLILRPRRTGDLPVLVHVVSQRARVLRLRRTGQSARDIAVAVLPSSHPERSRRPIPSAFPKLNSPAHQYLWSTLRSTPRDAARKTRGQDGFATLLSCRALSSPTTCRFSPALDGLPTARTELSTVAVARLDQTNQQLYPPIVDSLSVRAVSLGADTSLMRARSSRNFPLYPVTQRSSV
jgi:hypothetical protein